VTFKLFSEATEEAILLSKKPHRAKRRAKEQGTLPLVDFVGLLDRFDCLISLFDFIGPVFDTSFRFPLVRLITTCLDGLPRAR
jgi:hypothetical protein